MFFVFISLPMFCADAPSASFVATHKSTGRRIRRCDFAAIVTEVSVTPSDSFASVLPVQGAIRSKSHIFSVLSALSAPRCEVPFLLLYPRKF